MTLDDLLSAILLALAIFLSMFGLGLFAAGIMPGPSAPPWRQYGASAVCLTCSYYLFRVVFA